MESELIKIFIENVYEKIKSNLNNQLFSIIDLVRIQAEVNKEVIQDYIIFIRSSIHFNGIENRYFDILMVITHFIIFTNITLPFILNLFTNYLLIG